MASVDDATLIESAKKLAAIKAVDDYFDPSFRFVGIGSGTTIQYVVDAIRQKCPPECNTLFIPTGWQSRAVIEGRGLMAVNFDSLREDILIDVAFDGADEVDEEMNCVKGGGACLFQEKLVATRAKKFVCIADFRKIVPRLLTNWPYIPIEVAPIAVKSVIRDLKLLGSPNPTLRLGSLSEAKAGPLKTDQDFYIIKAPFPPLSIRPIGDAKIDGIVKDDPSRHGKTVEGLEGTVYEVRELAQKIKNIRGVLEVGIFSGVNGPEAAKSGLTGGEKPVACYFGMRDGTVTVRKAPGEP